MEWINYHHLLYFWTVAKEGSVTRACEVLRLAQPTISGQLKQLEATLGVQLLRREGRGLALTDAGAVAFDYANDIFSLGQEMLQTLRGQLPERPIRLRVGVPDVVPKLIAHRILAPAYELESPVHVICVEGKLDALVARLATFELDLVIADTPLSPRSRVRAYHHRLGRSGVSIFGARSVARGLRRGFPGSVGDAPWVLPIEGTALRHELDRWFDQNGILPRVVGEFDDMALLKAFGASGTGLFAGPSAIEAEIQRQYQVDVLGRCEGIGEEFHAISVERRIRHPAIAVITDAARTRLFS